MSNPMFEMGFYKKKKKIQTKLFKHFQEQQSENIVCIFT